MKILIIEHADHENPGIILDWIAEKKIEYKTIKPFAGDLLNNAGDFDFLIIMGGPQSPLEVDIFPYLIDEIKFTKKAVSDNKKVLGICLGAQIISEALGSKTQKSTYKEYGFFPVKLTESALKLNVFKEFPEELVCLHWHNDMPGLENSMTLLGYSQGCPVQSILYNENVIGLQYHMEIRRQDIYGLIDFDIKTLNEKDKFIMNPEEILNNDFELMNSYMKKFLDNFTR